MLVHRQPAGNIAAVEKTLQWKINKL